MVKSGNILDIEPPEFPGGQDVEYERKRGFGMFPRF